jgi:hypothetical protein
VALAADHCRARSAHGFSSLNPFNAATRDAKAVHGDVNTLLEAGVLCRSPEGQMASTLGQGTSASRPSLGGGTS